MFTRVSPKHPRAQYDIHLSLIELSQSNLNDAYDYCHKGVELNLSHTRPIRDKLVLLLLNRDLMKARMDNVNLDVIIESINKLKTSTGFAEYNYAYEYY